jgi:uncharacterized protein (TIGR02147 family)
MKLEKYFFQNVLKDDFSARKNKNPRFSLRAYANFLDINASSLSAIFKGKRSLPINSAHLICKKLNLDDAAQVTFIDTIIQFRRDKLQTSLQVKKDQPLSTKQDSTKILSEDEYHEIITEWEFYAVLNLIKIKGFQLSIDSVSKRLNLTAERAEYIIDKLYLSKLINKDDQGKVTRVFNRVNTTNNIPSMALKLAHHNELNLAKEKLYNTPVEKRLFTSRTLPVNSNKIVEAKKYLEEVKDHLSKLVDDSQSDEVYNLSINFFPLSKSEDYSV